MFHPSEKRAAFKWKIEDIFFKKTCVCRSRIWQRPKALKIWGHLNIFRLLCGRVLLPLTTYIIPSLCVKANMKRKIPWKYLFYNRLFTINRKNIVNGIVIGSIFKHQNNTTCLTFCTRTFKRGDKVGFLLTCTCTDKISIYTYICRAKYML